jgi:hypothetical protein
MNAVCATLMPWRTREVSSTDDIVAPSRSIPVITNDDWYLGFNISRKFF